MKIGFSKLDITPSLGSVMCGQLFEYRAKGVESKLYATAMCIDDGQVPVIIVSCDVLMITNEKCAAICSKASEATGIPATNIIVCATHTHSGPYTVSVFGMEADAKYLQDLDSNIVEALKQAYLNRKEARFYIAEGKLSGWAFNRRFIMSDGTVQTHPLKLDPHIVKVEGPDSDRLVVFYAGDADGKALGAAVNFGCHGTVMERDNQLINADYPGKVCEFVAKSMGQDSVALFLQGSAGNICQVNPLDESRQEVGLKWSKQMGRAVGQKALELAGDAKTPATGPMRVITETIEIPRRAIDPELLAWARKHKDIPSETPLLSNYGAELYGTLKRPLFSLDELFKTPFWANFYANEIRTLQRLRDEQPLLPLTLKVIAQDNWALVALPAEVFVEWADAICEKSPFEHTAVVTLANGWNGYIPTKHAFQRAGGYETKEVTSTMLIPEAGEMVLETVLKMLAQARSPVD